MKINHSSFWNLWATVVYHYPQHPDIQAPSDYQRFLYTLGFLHPSKKLRQKYLHVYQKDWDFQINSYLNSRQDLAKWGELFFNRVVLNLTLDEQRFPKKYQQQPWSWQKITDKLGVLKQISPHQTRSVNNQTWIKHRLSRCQIMKMNPKNPYRRTFKSLERFLNQLVGLYPQGDPSNDMRVLYRRFFHDLRFVFHPLVSPKRYETCLAKYPVESFLRNQSRFKEYVNILISKCFAKP